MRTEQKRSRSQAAWLRRGGLYRLSSPLLALTLVFFLSAQDARAAYTNLIGFPELQLQLGAGIPTGSGIAIQHVEAVVASGLQAGNYAPDPNNVLFTGKTLTNITFNAGMTQGSLGPSNHARGVGAYIYGTVTSVAPDITSIDVFEANHWMGFNVSGTTATAHPSGFLNTLGGIPDTTVARVANHSWVGEFTDLSVNSQVVRRLDFVVEQDDFINVVGTQNGFANSDKTLLKTAFNEISVGVTSGDHYQATLGLDSVYASGRTAPDVVAPGLNSPNTLVRTSLAVPMVSSVAALLMETAQNNSLSNGTIANRTRTINHAETSEVIKAVLMAGSDRSVDNAVGPDLHDYALDTSNNLDLDYGAGQVNVLHSYNILASGEHDSDQDRGNSLDIAGRGWDYDPNFGGANSSNDSGSYFFTAANTGDVLHATLAWNIEVHGFTSNSSNTTLRDLNLMLYDVTNNQLLTAAGASSQSTTENTENIFFAGLVAGNRYEIRVEAASGQAAFDWDYGLAWRIDQVPEPSGAGLTVLGVLSALAAGHVRSRRIR